MSLAKAIASRDFRRPYSGRRPDLLLVVGTSQSKSYGPRRTRSRDVSCFEIAEGERSTRTPPHPALAEVGVSGLLWWRAISSRCCWSSSREPSASLRQPSSATCARRCVVSCSSVRSRRSRPLHIAGETRLGHRSAEAVVTVQSALSPRPGGTGRIGAARPPCRGVRGPTRCWIHGSSVPAPGAVGAAQAVLLGP